MEPIKKSFYEKGKEFEMDIWKETLEARECFEKYKGTSNDQAYWFFTDDSTSSCRGRYLYVKKIYQTLPKKDGKLFLKYAVKLIKKNVELYGYCFESYDRFSFRAPHKVRF